MERGVLARFLDDRGFGFIRVDSGGEDVFVHSLELARCGLPKIPAIGTRLAFDIGQGSNGKLRAVNLRAEKDAAPEAAGLFR